MEAALLAAFMFSACVFGVLLEHPGSPLHQSIESPLLRRALIGLAMGCTLVAIVYSRWGQRSGAHMNPSVTLTFLTLGKIEAWDAVFNIASQFVGGIAGVIIARLLLGPPLSHSAVNYAVTAPGEGGAGVAFWAEVSISLLMMSTILVLSNTRRFNRYTGLFAGALLAMFITVEAPLSGVSLNPARTLGSALPAGEWSAVWLYFTAPPLAMLAAGQFYRLTRGLNGVLCAKLHHYNQTRCIFRCNYGAIDVNE
jgi:aquaporin Z